MSLLNSTNADYHANRTHLSSSGLKLLLTNPSEFHAKYVVGGVREEFKQVYQDGTLLHALILEPETIATSYAIFPGLRKAGRQYDDFCLNNPGKTIISVPQMKRAETWFQGYKRAKLATDLLSGGLPEHTMLGTVLDVPVKVRADYINVSQGYIADVKTTSAFTDHEVFKLTVQDFNYALSASLYCEVARQNYNKLFDFYFVVVSKQDGHCAVYKASSETLAKGSADMISAVVLYKKCMASGLWQLDQPSNRFETNEEVLEV